MHRLQKIKPGDMVRYTLGDDKDFRGLVVKSTQWDNCFNVFWLKTGRTVKVFSGLIEVLV